MKYSIKGDANFGVDNEKIKSDAYVFKTDLAKKRDQKYNRKMKKRVKRTLRLKPIAIVNNQVNDQLAQVMKTHAPEKMTQTLEKQQGFVDQIDNSSDDYILLDGNDSDQRAAQK